MKLKQILAVVTIISLIVSIFSTMQASKHKAESRRLATNLYSKTVTYEDRLGRQIVETTQLEIRVRELRKVMKKDSSQLSEYERTIYRIGKELNYSRRKFNKTKYVATVNMSTESSIAERAVDTVYMGLEAKTARVEDKFGKYIINYVPETDSLFLEVIQRNELYIDVFKERKKNSKGKKAFILWRWTMGYEYKGSIKTLNNATTVTDFTIIEIKKK